MQQGMRLRVGIVGSFASTRWVTNSPLYTHRNHGARIVMAAQTKARPRITRLRKEEIAQVLPWTGSGEQRLQKLGTPSTWVARLALSLAGSVVLYNYNTLAAAMASLYWAWDPVLSTALANTVLRAQYPYAGVWKARVLYAKVVKPAQRSPSTDVFQEIFEAKPAARPILKLVIGDESSATLEMNVGVPSKRYQVQIGEPVEVLVLSDTRSLARFIAVRDVYLPNMGIWLSESPCIERQVFEGLIEDLREGFSWPSMLPPAKMRDTQAVNTRLPRSGGEVGEESLEQWSFNMDSPSAETTTLGRPEQIQLSDERFESFIDEDLMLQSLRRPEQKQSFKELQRRGLQEAIRPSKQYMQMQDFDGEFEGRWEQDEVNRPQAPGQPRQREVSDWDKGNLRALDGRANSSRQPMRMRPTDERLSSTWDEDEDDDVPSRRQPRGMQSFERVSDSTWEQEEEPSPSRQPRQMWTFDADLQSTWDEDREYRPLIQQRQSKDLDTNIERRSISSKKSKEILLINDDFEQQWDQEIVSRPSRRRGQMKRLESTWEEDEEPRASRIFRGNQQYDVDLETIPDQEEHRYPMQSRQMQVSDGDSRSSQGQDATQFWRVESEDEEDEGVLEEKKTFRPSRQSGQMQSFHRSQERRAPEMPDSIGDGEENY